MRNFLTDCTVVFILASSSAFSANPHPVPVLEDLIQPWIFARASEASTLFIDKSYKGREAYGHIIPLGEKRYQWLEFNGSTTQLWDIIEIKNEAKQLTLTLQTLEKAENKVSRMIIYPYWDIDQCLIITRFDPDTEENPVRFATPYRYKNQLPYLEPE